MLKGVPRILSPDLLKTLMEMGHGEEIVIADGNFPAGSVARRLVRCDGHDVPDLLDAILRFFPLDGYVAAPVSLMAAPASDVGEPTIWERYRRILQAHEPVHHQIEFVERFAFYEKARQAYAVVTTGERALCANIILKKGVVIEPATPNQKATP